MPNAQDSCKREHHGDSASDGGAVSAAVVGENPLVDGGHYGP